jgi:GTPase SAR1 family protein
MIPEAETISDELTTAETVHKSPECRARDKIVLLGTRAAGKTIFLSVLYSHLWPRLKGLTLKSGNGVIHKSLIGNSESLKQGEWPPATASLAYCPLTVAHNHTTRELVALDYPGEVFRKAFVEGVQHYPEAVSWDAESLVRTLDTAIAVIVLIDPANVCFGDLDEQADDSYGMVQAIEYLRKSPGGDRVPVIVVLTKSDKKGNRQLIKNAGGPAAFLEWKAPALCRLLNTFRIMEISCVQQDKQGRPKRDSAPVNIDKPLLACLEALEREDHQTRLHAAELQRVESIRIRQDKESERDRRAKRNIVILIATMIVVAACICAIIWVNSGKRSLDVRPAVSPSLRAT